MEFTVYKLADDGSAVFDSVKEYSDVAAAQAALNALGSGYVMSYPLAVSGTSTLYPES